MTSFRRTAIAALGAVLLTCAAASAATISGRIVHLGAGKQQFARAGDLVRVSNGRRWFVAATNSDGSFVLQVDDSNDGWYGLYVPAYGQQYKVRDGAQPTYFVRDAAP